MAERPSPERTAAEQARAFAERAMADLRGQTGDARSDYYTRAAANFIPGLCDHIAVLVAALATETARADACFKVAGELIDWSGLREKIRTRGHASEYAWGETLLARFDALAALQEAPPHGEGDVSARPKFKRSIWTLGKSWNVHVADDHGNWIRVTGISTERRAREIALDCEARLWWRPAAVPSGSYEIDPAPPPRVPSRGEPTAP